MLFGKPALLLTSAALFLVNANHIVVEHALVPSIAHLASAEFKPRGVLQSREGYQLSTGGTDGLQELCSNPAGTTGQSLYLMRLKLMPTESQSPSSVLISRPVPIDCHLASNAKETLTLHFTTSADTKMLPFHADYSIQQQQQKSNHEINILFQLPSVGPVPRLDYRRVEQVTGKTGADGKVLPADQKEQTFFQKYVRDIIMWQFQITFVSQWMYIAIFMLMFMMGGGGGNGNEQQRGAAASRRNQ